MHGRLSTPNAAHQTAAPGGYNITRVGIESGSAWSIIPVPIVRTWNALLDMWTSGNTQVVSLVLRVTPPPVFCPREPSRIAARNNSKKSGSRFSEATVSSRLMSEAGLPFVPSKLPPVLSATRGGIHPLLSDGRTGRGRGLRSAGVPD